MFAKGFSVFKIHIDADTQASIAITKAFILFFLVSLLTVNFAFANPTTSTENAANPAAASNASSENTTSETPIIRLKLNGKPRFQFAGYYAALYKGFYEAENLNVQILPAGHYENSIQTVLSKAAEFGIADGSVLLNQRKQDAVTILAPIFQHSTQALFALPNRQVKNVYQLDYKRIALFANENHSLPIILMFKELGITPNLLRYSDELNFSKLSKENIDAFSGHSHLRTTHPQLKMFSPRSFGIDFYGDMLFTHPEQTQQHPEIVKAFTQATLKGWEYAMLHPQEVAQYIQKNLNPKLTLDDLLNESKIVLEALDTANYALGEFDTGRLPPCVRIVVA